MATVLLTGFTPFADFSQNPSQQIAEALSGIRIAGHVVESAVLPVEFGRDVELLFPLIERLQPRLVLSLGLAATAPCIWVERIALNLRQTNEGERPIIAGGPPALFARLPTDAVARSICDVGVPAVAHVFAGTYLCNHIMYQVLHRIERKTAPRQAGFLHLPLSVEQALAEGRMQSSALPLSHLEKGVLAAIASILQAPVDGGQFGQ